MLDEDTTGRVDRDTRWGMGRRTRVALGVGAASGLLSGLFGVGGGTVIVPGLVLLLAVAQHTAHATSLAAILLIAPAALVGFLLDGSVAVGAAVALSAGAVAGAVGGAAVMQRTSAERLRQAFAVFLLLVAIRLIVPAEAASGLEQALDLPRALGLVGLGAAAGVLSAALGVGGGVVMVPALVLLFGFSQHAAQGTSLLVILPTAVMGVVRHQRKELIDWRLALLVGAGGVVTGLIGAQGALALPSALLQRLFALFVAAVAVRMLLPARRPRPETPRVR